jgi:hypothetical protein
MVFLEEDFSFGGVGEPPIDPAAFEAGVGGLVAVQRDGEQCLLECLSKKVST